ncbi:MAG: hypothetical protein ACYCWE_02875 [Eubacteriales bacterium]
MKVIYNFNNHNLYHCSPYIALYNYDTGTPNSGLMTIKGKTLFEFLNNIINSDYAYLIITEEDNCYKDMLNHSIHYNFLKRATEDINITDYDIISSAYEIDEVGTTIIPIIIGNGINSYIDYLNYWKKEFTKALNGDDSWCTCMIDYSFLDTRYNKYEDIDEIYNAILKDIKKMISLLKKSKMVPEQVYDFCKFEANGI